MKTFVPAILVANLLGILLGILIGTLIPAAALAQDCIEYDDYLHWVNSVHTDQVFDVVAYGDYLYAAIGDYGLLVIDISNLANPDAIDVIPVIGEARGLDIDDDYLYVAAYAGGLSIFDLANPAEPTLAAHEGLACWPYAVDIQWPVAYVTGDDPEFQLVNIVDPTNPLELGTLSFSGIGRDVVVDGYYAYVADSNHGLVVIEIGGSNDLSVVGYLNTWDGGANGVSLYGDYLYIAAQDGLCVVDISNPPEPQLHGSAVFADLRDVLVTGQRAFTASANHGVQAFDISDPASPQLTGNLELVGGASCLAKPFSYAYLYAGGYDDLHVIDKSYPDGPPLIGAVDTPGGCPDLVASGSYVYVADGNSGLQVIDVSTAATPFIAGSAPTSSYALGVDVAGSHAYVAAGGAGLEVFDVSAPATPTLIGEFDPAGVVANSVDVVGTLAYIADEGYGLRVVDISDPVNPSQIGSVAIGGGILYVDVVGDYAYACTWTVGLRVIDVSTPTAPILVGTRVFVGYIERLDANDNNHVYLACDNMGLYVADVSDPTNPQLIADVATPSLTHDVHAAGPYVYVADELSGVLVFDMTTPSDPQMVGVWGTERADALFADDSYVYTGHWSGGLRIAAAQCGAINVQVGVPQVPDLAMVVYPNPFNPLTRISFTLKRAGRAKMGVYDLGGHRVRILAERAFDAGHHSLDWNGCDTWGRAMPSGPYFVRLESETGKETKKVMLVR